MHCRQILATSNFFENTWERLESNPWPLGEKRDRYPLCNAGPGIALKNILWFTRLVAEQACYPHATTTALRNRGCADYRKPSRSFTSRSFSVVRVIFGKAHFSSLAENFQAPRIRREGFLQIIQSTGKFKLERSSNKTKLKKNPQLAKKLQSGLKRFCNSRD